MRLSSNQQHCIVQIVHRHLGEQARVRLYGSRLHEDMRGGDVDLIIESPQHLAPLARAALQLDLEQALQLPVDILHHQTDHSLTPFQAIAKADSQPLTPRPS